MDISGIFHKEENLPLSVEQCSSFHRCSYAMLQPSEEPDKENLLFATAQIDDLIKLVKRPEQIKNCIANDFAFYGSGWQSWGFGGEIECGKYQKEYIPIIPQWKQYITFPGKPSSLVPKEKLLKGQFIIYLRWGTTYMVIASTGNASPAYNEVRPRPAEEFKEDSRNKVLPPVQFFVDRNTRTLYCTAYSDGKKWRAGERIAEITIFVAYNYFALKNGIAALFGSSESPRMQQLEFLNCAYDDRIRRIYTAGWESWYNHYANIDSKLIAADLENLSKTDNLINLHCIQRNRPVVFQVDDGWEKACGQWEVDENRFPEGMTTLASSIEEKGFIPGLWLAPFIVDWRSSIAKNHRDWILRDKKGKPIPAGFHLLWGAPFGKDQPSKPYSYFCLDLSNDEVVDYLARVMDTVVNKWGFRYLKLDFLFAGMIDGVFKNGGAAYQWYDRAIRMITAIKENRNSQPVAYLGCGLPLESSFNQFPLSRIGPDTREAWDTNYLRRAHFSARAGAYANLQSTIGHAFWNKSVYLNDADVVFMRYENISLTDTEKELIALTDYMFSSQLMLSDDPVKFNSASEGFFTNHIENLFKILRETEWAVLNMTDETYCVYSKNLRFVGFINLSDKPVPLHDGQIHDELGLNGVSDSTAYEPLLLHATKTKNGYLMEKHSLSLWEFQRASI